MARRRPNSLPPTERRLDPADRQEALRRCDAELQRRLKEDGFVHIPGAVPLEKPGSELVRRSISFTWDLILIVFKKPLVKGYKGLRNSHRQLFEHLFSIVLQLFNCLGNCFATVGIFKAIVSTYVQYIQQLFQQLFNISINCFAIVLNLLNICNNGFAIALELLNISNNCCAIVFEIVAYVQHVCSQANLLNILNMQVSNGRFNMHHIDGWGCYITATKNMHHIDSCLHP